MTLAWGVFLSTLPLVGILGMAYKVPIPWEAACWWANAWIAALWAIASATSKRPTQLPIALGAWTVWAGLSFVGWGVYDALTLGRFPTWRMTGTLHLLSAILFVQAAIMSWRPGSMPRLLLWVRRGIVVALCYGVMQVLDLDEFQDPRSPSNVGRDVLGGALGNYNHFASFLAVGLPVLLIGRGLRWKLWSALAVVLLWMTRAESGMLAAGCAALWLCVTRPKLLFALAVVLVAIGVWRWMSEPGVALSMHSRWQRWELFWKLYASSHTILGNGQGAIFQFIKRLRPAHPLFMWHHIHNEWFQTLIEHGVVGVATLGWVVVDALRRAWRMRASLEGRACGAILIALMADGCFNFSWHLWVPASFGLLAYAGLVVLERERVAA